MNNIWRSKQESTVSRNKGSLPSKKMRLVLLYKEKSHFSPLSWRPLVIQSTISKLDSWKTLKICIWEYFAVEKQVTGSGMMTKSASRPTVAYCMAKARHHQYNCKWMKNDNIEKIKRLSLRSSSILKPHR